MSGTRAISTISISSRFSFLQGKAPKEIHAILTETLACFLPGLAKDLSAPLCRSVLLCNCITEKLQFCQRYSDIWVATIKLSTALNFWNSLTSCNYANITQQCIRFRRRRKKRIATSNSRRQNFHIHDPNILVTAVQNLIVRAAWCPEFVHPSYNMFAGPSGRAV